MHQRHYWSIKYIRTKEFPHHRFPLVLLQGEVGYVINQWICYLIDTGVRQSLFEERRRAVLHLYDFCLAKYGTRELTKSEAEALVGDFLSVKKSGSDLHNGKHALGLYWKPVQKRTLARYAAALESFDTWQVAFHDGPRLNPTESRILTAWEIYADFRRRENWDVMLHLFPARTHTRAVPKHKVPEYHARFSRPKVTLPRSFPLDAYVDLVESCSNPRDKMLYLQLFGLALRESEPLHLFVEDVFGVTAHGEAQIRLDDPESGLWQWRDDQGHRKTSSRTEYLKACWINPEFRKSHPDLYRLLPRTLYGRRGGMHVGFKGMTFHLSNDGNPAIVGHEAVWIDPRIGVYFTSCFREYMREYFYGKPHRWPFHPWLYIQLDAESFGMPMTIPALKKVWARSMRRLGLEHLDVGPHSLRHLGGYYCANVLKLPLETTKSLLRHSAIDSTQTYYHISNQTVRSEIIKAAAARNSNSHLSDLLTLAESPKLVLPDHWCPAAPLSR